MRHCLGEHRLECDEFAMGNRAASFGCRFWILCARLCPRAAGKRHSTVGIRWGRCGEQFAQVCRQNLRHNSHQCTCRLILGARTPIFLCCKRFFASHCCDLHWRSLFSCTRLLVCSFSAWLQFAVRSAPVAPRKRRKSSKQKSACKGPRLLVNIGRKSAWACDSWPEESTSWSTISRRLSRQLLLASVLKGDKPVRW